MADTPDDDVSYDSRRGRGYSPPPPPRTQQQQPQQPASKTPAQEREAARVQSRAAKAARAQETKPTGDPSTPETPRTALDGARDQHQSPSSRALKKQTEQRLKAVEDQGDTTGGNVRRDGNILTARKGTELPQIVQLCLVNGIPVWIRGPGVVVAQVPP